MKPSQLKQHLINSFHAKTPSMIWGQPGIGKSDIVRLIAQILGVGLIDQRLSQMDPVDMRGIPFKEVIDKVAYTMWATPGFLPNPERDGEAGILFLDEINTAPQMIQAAAYQLILDRRLGDYVLPDNWVVIAAGNRAEDGAIAVRMSSALANRFGHWELDVNFDEWKDWAIGNNIHEDIISFLNYKSELLNDFDRDKHAFPTPRSWEMFNKHFPLLDESTMFNTLKGFVGKGVASEFVGYMQNKEQIPQLHEILQDPKGCRLPNEPSAMYAMGGMVAAKAEKDNFGAILEYLGRVPEEYQVVSVQDAIRHNNDLGSTKEFIDWSIKNNGVIL